MYQGGSDALLGPTDDIVGDPDWGIDFEAEVAVITGPVNMGATPEEAARAIRFVMLLNDISLRHLIPGELAKGFGFVQSKPACACSPVAEGGRGYSCIAEQRVVETLREGAPRTPFLRPGDRVRIWMADRDGRSIFGDIDQRVAERSDG
jgi:2-keto-4-pentenoate hydratase/2-oxohepta-3-ene-1,7-dioic acid hydratase in catechol pathway